jgi:hypothetical protein
LTKVLRTKEKEDQESDNDKEPYIKTRDYKELQAIEGNRGYSVVGN